MTGTRTYEAVDATFVLLVNDAQYRYLADKDGKPFAYFLNPAAYGGGVAKVRWDEASETWFFENNSDTNDPGDTPPASFSYLDDRYTLGAGYGANNLLVSGDTTITQGYKAPLGAALPASEIKIVGGEVVVPGFNSVSLTPTYESAEIKPVLILKVYESRLASYDFYAYLGEYEWSLDEEDELTTADSRHDLLEMYTNLVGSKKEFIQTLAQQWVDRLNNEWNPESVDAAIAKNAQMLNYNLQKFYGDDVYNDWSAKILLVTDSYAPAIISIPSLSYYDGYNIRGEKADEVSSGHLARPHVELPGLTRVVGHEYYGLKSMRGVYTIFPRPEQLVYLANVVTEAVANVTAGLVTGPDHLAVVTAALTEQLNVHWYDYFRGSESTVTVPVAWDTNGDVLDTKDVVVNVFVGINTQGNLVAEVNFDGNTYMGMGVNLGDTFSYYTNQTEKAQPFPSAYGYVTGPYGSQVLVDKDGNKIGYKSDAYSV